MLKLLESLTKMNQESQASALRLFSKIDISTQLDIFEHQKQLFYKLKNVNSNVDNSILTLSSFILAICFITERLDIVNLSAIKIRTRNKKVGMKREKILGYFAIIKTLKSQENMSFRQISKYLAKYHKFEVSHCTIFKVWNEVKNTNTQENKNGI